MIIEVPDDTPIISIMRLALNAGCRIEYEDTGNLKFIPDADMRAKGEERRTK